MGDPTLVDPAPAERIPRQPCLEPDGAPAVYHARVFGMLALLLRERPRVSAVMYVDADVWFSDAAHTAALHRVPEGFLSLAPKASLFGNGNHFRRPLGVWLNSGILLLRNTAWSKRLLHHSDCLLYTSPSPRDGLLSRMPSSA